MPPREPDRLFQQSSGILLGLLVLSLNACGGNGTGLTFPATTGTLQVTTTTSGEELDPDGYTLQVDTETPEPIGTAGSIERTELAPGDHLLRLEGMAPNCSAADNPRTVRIVAGETLTSAFAVTCSATTGGVVINTVTTGATPDPDGYAVVFDGVEQGAVPSSGQATLTGLAPGSHVVGLSGVAGNCQVQGENLRPVTVTAGTSATVDYAITCAAPPVGAGTLRIITVTTGSDPDPDGYSFTLDGGESQPIGINTALPITNVAPGGHRVQLSGLSGNCRVQGGNSRSVTVPAGGSVDATFTISCNRAAGTIRITASTTGRPADPDGYIATLDGAPTGQAIGSDGTVRFTDVAVGNHVVTLSDVAANCSVTGGVSRNVSVTDGGTAEVSFRVLCSAVGESRIEMVSGNNQSAQVNAQLPQPLVVRVRDGSGNPVSGVVVQWTAEGGGSVSAASTQTDANGEASVTRTLGPSAGEQRTRAAASGMAGSPVIFTHTAVSDKAASTITITSDQPDPSVPGEIVRVEFRVSGPGGTPTGDVTVTVSDGSESCTGTVASGFCELTLNEVGSRTLTATYGGDSGFTGSSDTEVHQVNAPENIPPRPAFDPPTCIVEEPCQFTDASTDEDGTIVAWVWDFGDGETSEQQNPIHTYLQAGEYPVTLVVSDDRRTTRPVTHQVTVQPATPENSPPTARDDAYTTNAGVGFSAPDDARAGLLANDEDPDADPLSTDAETKSTTSGGTVTIRADGSFEYQPPPDSYTGADSFDYTVNDGNGGSDTGTANIDVQPGG